MNMLMHGVDYKNFHIRKGDTLTNDTYGDVKMTVQVCNPPYSLKWDSPVVLLDDPRYSGVGKLAPKSAADFAFVQHMVHHMDDADGNKAHNTMASVSMDKFIEYPVNIPDVEEQNLIIEFLSSFDEAIAAAKEELAKWKELKKGLLQQMFV